MGTVSKHFELAEKHYVQLEMERFMGECVCFGRSVGSRTL